MPKPDPKYFLWIDMETTGLDPHEDQPLEVAALITTPDLREVDGYERFHSLLYADRIARARIDSNEYVKAMHTKNGLLAEIDALGEDAAAWDDTEMDLCDFIKEHCPEGPVFLAGSGVAAFDMKFIESYFPAVRELLDYRTIDVGQIRRFLKHVMGWQDDAMPAEADDNHRATSDVLNALDQARSLRDLITP